MQTRLCPILLFAALLGCGTSPPPQSPATQPSVKAPNESAALDAIKKINEAQSDYFKKNRRYALTFNELTEAHLLAGEPTTAQTGYEFKLRPAADAQTYKLVVSPAAKSATARYFFTDQTGSSVHAETGKDATEDSPRI